MERKYKNTADKQTTWFVIFFILIALTISVIVAVLVPNEYLVIAFFSTLLPLTAIFIILALYLTSSKVKAKKGLKKYDQVMSTIETKYEGKLIRDVHLEGKKIDYIFISPYGVYVITLKNYEGSIYGLDTEKVWRQSLAFKKIKNPLPNPVLENQELIIKLKERTKLKVRMNPVVCIASGNRGYLLSQYVYSPNQLNDLIPTGTPKILKAEEIEHIYKVILAIK